MKKTSILARAAIATILGLTTSLAPVSAQTLREGEVPAEFPPASFKGKQYVDSRGCVYIRAGIDGQTNWVPRVTRDRQVLCGYQPSLAEAAAPKTAPKTDTAAAAPIVITPEPTAEPAETEKPAPATEPVVTVEAEKPKVEPVAEPAQMAKPEPKMRKTAKAAPVRKSPARKAKPAKRKVLRKAKPVAKTRRVAKPVPGANCVGVQAPAIAESCRNQEVVHVTTVSRETVTVMRNGKPVKVQRRIVLVKPKASANTTPLVISSKTRIVPRHVWEQQQRSKVLAPTPKGFRPAWKDDRLNPQRAHQTIDGAFAIDLAWTRTVPRELYVRSTGRVVTDKYPGLIYPYHSYDEMRAAGFDVINPGPGVKTKKPLFARKAKVRKKTLVATKTPTVTAPAPKPAQKTKLKPTATNGRFIQVGTFGVEANARNTAARLKGMGLPVRLGKLVKGGKSYRIVIAGPFAPGHLQGALQKTRAAGFRDAFVR